MPWFDFFWYDQNIAHLAVNGVTPEEFEEVVMKAKRFDFSRSGRDMVQGTTSAGRYLVCIFDRIDEVSIMPITAFEPTKGQK